MEWAVFVLRFGIGVVFMAHGLQKAFGLWGGPGISGFSEMLSGLGFVPAMFWAYVAAGVELIGGLCLIIGFFSRIAAMLILILVLVAAFKVHLQKGFFLSAGGFEYIFLIACACAAIIILETAKR